MATLKQRHDAYIADYQAKGGHVLNFKTPCCRKQMKTPAPRTSETWDSLTICQHCGDMFMKIVTNSEAVGSRPPRARAPR